MLFLDYIPMSYLMFCIFRSCLCLACPYSMCVCAACCVTTYHNFYLIY